jgi:succinyl-CoA synthetase beta subunit
MNLHEYQAKELLGRYNVPTQTGVAVSTPEEAVAAYKKIAEESGSKFAVIKAQIRACSTRCTSCKK